jgi:hypothetical protein
VAGHEKKPWSKSSIKTERTESAGDTNAFKHHQKALATIQEAKRALAAGEPVELVEVNKAFETLHTSNFPTRR